MASVRSERFWDERARENALFYVDTRLEYDNPDEDEFWRSGEEVVDSLLDAVGLTIGPAETVVDIGCGVGRISRALAARASHVYGVDVSSEMLARARRYNDASLAIEWLHGDGESLEVLPAASVDGCFSFVVFQHIPDPAVTLRYVREMGRVLRPGGWALFQVSTDPSVHRGQRSIRERAKALVHRDARFSDRAWRGSYVEIKALERAADQGQLEVERLLDVGSQYTTVYLRRRA
ncbi:MAG: methyltransferase domain-containing protein [Actinomycetota bacterium]|nr:methyltransferase domain-containing protein [Actinomycetota bacterium]